MGLGTRLRRSGVSEQAEPDRVAPEQSGPEQPLPEQPLPEQPAPEQAAPERSGQQGRYTRSTGGMVGALMVTLLVIGAFVAFRAFDRSNLDVKPERVDYLSQVRIAQQSSPDGAGDVVYPARLPAGWYATNVTFSPDGTRTGIDLSMLTPDDYVGYVASPESVADLLTTYVDPHPTAGAPVEVDGSIAPRWDTWTDGGGDTALSAQHGGQSLLVFGTTSPAQLEQLAASLTTANVAH